MVDGTHVQEFKKDEIALLNNKVKVTILWQTPQRLMTRVKRGDYEWTTLTYRLTKL